VVGFMTIIGGGTTAAPPGSTTVGANTGDADQGEAEGEEEGKGGTAADEEEPASATDPSAPYVYLLATRYTGPTACGNQCPLPYHVLKISSDGGATWGPDQYLCTCRGAQGQFHPQIEVVA